MVIHAMHSIEKLSICRVWKLWDMQPMGEDPQASLRWSHMPFILLEESSLYVGIGSCGVCSLRVKPPNKLLRWSYMPCILLESCLYIGYGSCVNVEYATYGWRPHASTWDGHTCHAFYWKAVYRLGMKPVGKKTKNTRDDNVPFILLDSLDVEHATCGLRTPSKAWDGHTSHSFYWIAV